MADARLMACPRSDDLPAIKCWRSWARHEIAAFEVERLDPKPLVRDQGLPTSGSRTSPICRPHHVMTSGKTYRAVLVGTGSIGDAHVRAVEATQGRVKLV